MGHQTYVVFNETNDLYFTGYVGETPMWGSLNNAVEYETLQAAQEAATAIGGGGVGLPKPH